MPESPLGRRVLDRLLEEQRIDRQQHDQVLVHAAREGTHCVEILIRHGVVDEGQLLKWLAKLLRTQYVSTQKLSRAGIPRTALRLLPKKVCERYNVCPILFDADKQALSVVATDPDPDLPAQLATITGVKEVKAYVARPAAIAAAIRKHYDADPNAFAPFEGYRSTDFSGSTEIAGLGSGLYDVEAGGNPGNFGGGGMQSFGYGDAPQPFGVDNYAPQPAPPPQPTPPRPPVHTMPRSAPPAQVAAAPPTTPGFTIEAPAIMRARTPPPPAQGGTATQRLAIAGPMVMQIPSGPVPSDGLTAGQVAFEDYVQTVQVLVALIEQDRAELRGHSAEVARLCQKVCIRMGLGEMEMQAVRLAAMLHDLGKGSTFHLTSLNVAMFETHRTQAQKVFKTPLRFFESISLPDLTSKAITHLYELYDGSGFPGRLAGKDIPFGARLLAIAETYADLTSNPRNPYRRALDAKAACDAIADHRAGFFDSNLVDVFRVSVLGDDLKAKLTQADRQRIALVDPEPEETTVLELRLIEQGFDVQTFRNADDFLAARASREFDLLLTEVELEGSDGFELVRQVPANEVPAVFLTHRADRESVTRGFGLGAADYLAKPVPPDVVVAKITQILSTRKRAGSRGVSGSLREMSLADVLQVLSNGRKTGHLAIQSNGRDGLVAFRDGSIFSAFFAGLENEEAIYAMLALPEGEFTLDPTFQPDKRKMNASTEALLLEGMRRIDEGG